MLRSERLVERSQGVGTHAVIGPPKTTMDEALGVIGENEILDAATRPRVLDRSTLPAPDTLAAWLGPPLPGGGSRPGDGLGELTGSHTTSGTFGASSIWPRV